MSAKCCFEMRKQSYNRHLSIHPGSIPTHIWSTGTSSAVHFRHYSFTTENHKRWIPDRVPWDRGDGTPRHKSRETLRKDNWIPGCPCYPGSVLGILSSLSLSRATGIPSQRFSRLFLPSWLRCRLLLLCIDSERIVKLNSKLLFALPSLKRIFGMRGIPIIEPTYFSGLHIPYIHIITK